MQNMYRDINAKVAEPGATKKAVTFRAAYQKMRKARLLKTMKEPEGERYKVTYQRELQDWIYPGRRRGAPKHTWGRKALEALWEEARIGRPEWRGVELVGTKFDNRDRQDVRDRLKEYAGEEYNRLEKEKGKENGKWVGG